MAIHLTSAGIVYTGTQDPAQVAGSGVAYTLDDYEEVTYTGAIAGAAGIGPYGFAYTTGYYTKIAQLVTVSHSNPLSSIGSVSGAGTLTGLPFATSRDGGFFMNFGNAAASSSRGGSIQGTTMNWRVPNSLNSAEWLAGSEVKFMITGNYFTDA